MFQKPIPESLFWHPYHHHRNVIYAFGFLFFRFQRVGISHGKCSFCSNAAIWCSQELPQIVTHNQAVQMIKDNKVFRQGPLIQYKKPTYKKAPTTPYLICIQKCQLSQALKYSYGVNFETFCLTRDLFLIIKIEKLEIYFKLIEKFW